MAGYNQELYDRVIQHLADVRLYEMETHTLNGRAIRRHDKRLRALLVKNIKSDIKPEVLRSTVELYSNTDRAINEFDSAAVTFHANNLSKSTRSFFRVDKPTGSSVVTDAIGPNIGLSKPLQKHFNDIGTSEIIRIQGIIGRGLAEGKTKNEIIQLVSNATKITQFKVAALVRTSITNTESVALDRVMEANKDVVYGYRFTAVLDSRTSPICSAHDGEVYKIGDNRYRPPLHWNCRSSMVPVLKSKKQLQEEAAAKVNQKALDKIDPKLLDGNPPPVEDYSTWLKRQPMDVKASHLGSEEHVSLFDKGILTVKEFITKLGNQVSIARLRKLDNARTVVFPTRQHVLTADAEAKLVVNASRPYDLVRSPAIQDELRAMYISDAESMNQAMSVTDYRGTSLIGKRTTRLRANNAFDERNQQFDPFTGEMKTTLVYEPDYTVYQERLDFMRNSKVLTKDQKGFIESFAESLEDKIGVNNQTVVVENLRLLFERYSNDKTPWDNFANLARKEAQYSVVNVSRILDRRSRERAEAFASYGQGDEAKVQILGKYYTFDHIANNMLDNQRYVQNWAETTGRGVAQDAYLSGRAPLKAYFQDPDKDKPWWVSTKEAKKQLIKAGEKAVKSAPGGGRLLSFLKGEPREGIIQEFLRGKKAEWRALIDTEITFGREKRSYKDRMLTSVLDNDKAVNVLAKAIKVVASGNATDYDSIAISIGKSLRENWQPAYPWHKSTMQEYHADGSRILQGLRDQGKIRVLSRGKVRRSVIDLETGRPSGAWKDTVSREVTILDKDMLELQSRNRQVLMAQRIGNVNPRDKLEVVPGKKVYVDPRGRDTGISIITRRASENYDKILVDQDFADMLNHSMNTEYETDQEFAGFMDEVVRFRDPRGNSKKYDELNDFRKLIIQRGDQGYGFMQTVKWHNQRGKPFKVQAQIDGRGRVYYTGYLSPTGGEVVRPFLNSSVARQFGVSEMRELMVQTGSLIGPATEALTQAGRLEIFMRNEKDVRSLGDLLMAKTQRDQKIRDFLEHPLVRAMEAEEVPKMTRLALEYARVHKHTGGKLTDPSSYNGYLTKLMIENDASSSGAQIIGLSTRDRDIAINSNVLATTKKNRLYDLVAMDTVADPEFQQIPSLVGANITWTDLQKAAKAQNMVSFYGAGKATQAANIEAKFASVLGKKGYTVITKDDLNAVNAVINKAIKDADYIDAVNVSNGLKSLKREIAEVVDGETTVSRELMKEAADLHPDVATFVERLTDVRVGIVGPNDFIEVSEILSRHLTERAPVTRKFVQFWNAAANAYVQDTQAVDIPWVTFDGKTLYQRYRPKIQTSIEFYDPESRRMVRNIYEDSAKDGTLLGKASISRARIGMGVNGNHMNDATIVRQFHLWGRKNGVPTASIHDAFFTNIGDVAKAKTALRTIYADAVESETIRNTLLAMRKNGMSEKNYQELLKKAKEDGLIDPPNAVTRKDILADIPAGYDWYGIGP